MAKSPSTKRKGVSASTGSPINTLNRGPVSYPNTSSVTQETSIPLGVKYKALSNTDTYYARKVKEYIIGQDEQIDELVYIVYHNLHQDMMSEWHDITPDRYSAVVVGPSGCGKTATLTKISELFGVPFIKYNATPLTSGGFVGRDVENMIHLLIEKAHGNVELAKRGILYIDEIDKKVSTNPSNTSGRDVNGTAVQEELLKFLEPSIIDLGQGKTFDISYLTILMSGRFLGIENIRKKRLNHQTSVGFGNHQDEVNTANFTDEDWEFYNEFDDSKSPNYIHEDIINFGFLDEFVGRIFDVIEFNPLTKENLMDIIFSKGSPLMRFIEAIHLKNQELFVDDIVFERMVEAAYNSPRGVRCLENCIRKFLIPADRDFMLNYRRGIMEYDAEGNYYSVFDAPNGEQVVRMVESKRSKLIKKSKHADKQTVPSGSKIVQQSS